MPMSFINGLGPFHEDFKRRQVNVFRLARLVENEMKMSLLEIEQFENGLAALLCLRRSIGKAPLFKVDETERPVDHHVQAPRFPSDFYELHHLDQAPLPDFAAECGRLHA